MNPLLPLLERYVPTEEERLVKERMIEFVKTHPHCFERTLAIGHVTASAWLVSRDRQSVLLTHHAKFDRWQQLGGHCDGDPDVLAVAIREAHEESGIEAIAPISEEVFDLDIHEIPARGHEAAHLHYDVRFLLQVTSDQPFQISSESKSLKWFGRDPRKLPTQARSILRMFEKWAAK